MISIPARWIVAGLYACCFGPDVAYPADDAKSLDQLRREAMKSQSAQAQSDGTATRELQSLRPGLNGDAGSASCPSPNAVDSFRHEIAYERTEELNPLRGLGLINTRIWERGPLTTFYVDEHLRTFPLNMRLAYPVGSDGARGSFSCLTEQDWRKCVQGPAGLEAANYVVRTCTATLDLRTIPPWEPSPEDQTKRRIAGELRNEIEAKWQGVQRIVIRDFNLKDRQITMYLKLPDGDYFQGCGFHPMREPHCEGWHLFGHAPVSSIRKWIFEKPYRLK